MLREPEPLRFFPSRSIACRSLASVLLLTLGLAAAPDHAVLIIVLATLVSLTHPFTSLVLLTATTAVLLPVSRDGAEVLTATRIVGAGIALRCLFVPGVFRIARSLPDFNHLFRISLLIFVCAYSIALAYTGDRQSLIGHVTNCLTFVILASVCYQMQRKEEALAAILTGLLVAPINYCLYWTGLLEPTTIFGVMGATPDVVRVSVGSRDPNYLGGLLACLFGGSLVIALRSPSRSYRIASYIACLMSALALMETLSKSALLIAALEVSVVILLVAKWDGAVGWTKR